MQQRRLAAARWPDDGDDLAALDAQAHVPQRGTRTRPEDVRLAQVDALRRRHATSGPKRPRCSVTRWLTCACLERARRRRRPVALVALGARVKTIGGQVLRMVGDVLPVRVQVDQVRRGARVVSAMTAFQRSTSARTWRGSRPRYAASAARSGTLPTSTRAWVRAPARRAGRPGRRRSASSGTRAFRSFTASHTVTTSGLRVHGRPELLVERLRQRRAAHAQVDDARVRAESRAEPRHPAVQFRDCARRRRPRPRRPRRRT